MQRIACFIIVISVVGCASVSHIKNQSLGSADLRNQSIGLTARKSPDFTAMTTGKTMIPLGYLLAKEAGRGLVSEQGVQDPKLIITSALSRALEERYNVKVIRPEIETSSDDPGSVSDQFSNNIAYVLDVRTTNWYFAPINVWSSGYVVRYTTIVSIIEKRTRSVVAQAACDKYSDLSNKAPTYDALVANDAALLKTILAASASACAEQIKKSVLPAA